MSRVLSWLQHHENRMFCLVNQKMHHTALDRFFNTITHLGGATATIMLALCLAIFARGDWRTAGFEMCAALAVSHLPVAIIKKKYPRLRPYLVLPDTVTCKNPLTDHSFPSGHTTAVFSVAVPLMFIGSSVAIILLPLALLVGLSRIYLGLHYPSDCLAGSLIGSGTALMAVAVFS
ncbi:phosphatase PAP2 family protein [Paenibacillus filicis]|uniref:Phosphatase PAP2 family protein n=1 Tax=Paenibacillus gyeongsangnamensis TaxID=3388067 RepID=A0ABT4Q703_9BACL|nr:phosphatase PAP2 family protein [Paenibacillus filicis]MCZ8512611.1 phosphatase PAP2 family protein [Paenibacillus filicis]